MEGEGDGVERVGRRGKFSVGGWKGRGIEGCVGDKQTKMLPRSPRESFFVQARTAHCFGTRGAFWFACRQLAADC